MDQKPPQVQPAALCLMITGALNALVGLFGVVTGLIQAVNLANEHMVSGSGIAYATGYFLARFVYLLSLITAPVIIYGASRMLDGAGYNWAKAASILAIIPFTSCCFLIGAPIGIWALVVLSKPEVKMFFERGGADYQPPASPEF